MSKSSEQALHQRRYPDGKEEHEKCSTLLVIESESCSVVSDSLRPRVLYSPWNSPGQNTGVGSLSLLQVIFPTQGSNPGLPHYRRILYQLSCKGSPYSENLTLLRLAQIHLILSLNVFLKPYTHTAKGLCVVCMWSLGSLSPGYLLRCVPFFFVEFLWVLLVLKCL